MTRDFEERLRESLQTRASDVTPDPAMFATVQARIRRGRMTRWSLAGAGAVGLVAIATLVFPALNDRRVEFDPAPPVATQPASEAPEQVDSRLLPVPEGMVFTDGRSTYAMALDGESAELLWKGDEAVQCQGQDCASEPLITNVASHPGTSWSRIAIADRLSQNCGELTWGSAELGGDEDVYAGGGIFTEAQCPTAPVFSPDGGHVAWAAADVNSGDWSLHTVDWTEAGPGEDAATFGLELPAGGVVQLEDWYWTQQSDSTAAGSIALSVTLDDQRQVYLLAVERQGDGAIAVSGDPEATSVHEGYGAAAFADSGSGDGRFTYALLVSRENPQWSVVRSEVRTPKRPDHSAQRDLPDSLMPPVPTDVSDIWISAFGNTVVFGDGHGQAWLIEWNENGGTRPRALPATIVHADLFGGGGAPPTGDGDVPDDRQLAQVDVFFTQEGGECGEEVRAYPRPVEGQGVLRGALEQLLAGPTDEEVAAGARSIFTDKTAGSLNSVTITDDGLARVDFADFSDRVPGTSCVTMGVGAQLDATVKQFPNVEEAVYSFDGDIDAFYRAYELATPPHRPDIPLAVTRMQERIYDAVKGARQDDDWDPLARLIDRATFSCSFSDQNEDCIALWQQQEGDGQDPLGPLARILRGEPAQNPDAPIWVWPAKWMTEDEYLGPRTGIQRDGTWRYYQQGGD